jgi:hypothetical protein
MANIRPVWLAVVVFLASGCVSWSGHGVAAAPDGKVRIGVLPVQSEVEVDSLSDIETVPSGTVQMLDEKKAVHDRMEKITEDMTASIEARLSASPSFTLIPADRVKSVMEGSGMQPPFLPLSAEQIRNLCARLDAQAILTVRLTGYGRLKTRWVAYLIGSGVVEGVVEGSLAGGATRNIWVGLTVGLEEIGQEILTWGGGAYLFNAYYAPVTLEGALFSARDGESVWSDTAFDSIDRKTLKKLPEEERKRKEVQLRVTAEKVIKDLITDLEKTAQKNLRKERPAAAH